MYDAEKSHYVVGKYKGKEEIYVDNVRLCGTLHSHVPRRACITFRVPVSLVFLTLALRRRERCTT